MNVSKELCQLITRNAAFLEGGVFEAIEKPLFKAMNTRIETRLKALGGWKGRYELVSGETDATIFAPSAWPEDKAGAMRACYKMGAIDGDKNSLWLSCAVGVNGVKMCLRLWVHGGLGGRSKGEIERKLLGIAQGADVKAAGILRDEEGMLYLPFVFDAETLASEYPEVEKVLAPLDAALDKLLMVHPQSDAAVRELAKM